ncbi:uncharacterized protein LOC107260988 [Ricinus communis]|uniref:uncharacterized protein LOC107260988 n=1 Tax=Ricinus communis TaxID=3988 RepID=UPI0007729ABD|nr:uncharacterized protein LOC107260988 [Ricinus communis]|eukprot:XP_015572749.1 uncharacterized protein LOC107260988 [Ricinus communis]
MRELNEECSAIFQNKLPKKQRDPMSFTIPYVIGNLTISDALADLGASIDIMSYNLFAKLGLGETKSTRMNIQLADRSVKYPKGIVENVLVKVDKFIFLVDFVILDMDGEISVSLILGKHLLAISKAIIDVCDGELELKVGDKTVTLNLNNSMKQSLDHDDVVYSINVLNDVVETQLQEILVEDPLQVTLPIEDEHELSNEKVLEQLEFLLVNEPNEEDNKSAVIDRVGVQKLRPLIEESPVLDFKELPKHIDYAY